MNYKSIADCEICRHIPQKASDSIPGDVYQLLRIIDINKDDSGSSCTLRLLKCPQCATHYYYINYSEAAEVASPPTNEIEVRRYDAATAIWFLERKAADGAASRELDELRPRYDLIIRDLIEVIQHRALDYQLKIYTIQALCNHFAAQADWNSISDLLLKHSDAEVRVTAASLILNIALENISSADLMHMPERLRSFLKAEGQQQARRQELIAVLLDIALHHDLPTYQYKYYFGSAGYQQTTTGSVALESLSIAVRHQADLTSAIPTLVARFVTYRPLIYDLCELLCELAKDRRNAAAIIEEIERLENPIKQRLMSESLGQKLVRDGNQNCK